METMSIVPKVFVIKNALSEDECDYIINQTEGKFMRSSMYMKLKSCVCFQALACLWCMCVCGVCSVCVGM